MIIFSIYSNSYGSVYRSELNLSTRSFFGAVDEPVNYDFSLGLNFEQNRYLGYSFKKFGNVLTGFDFQYFNMSNAKANIEFYQPAVLSSFYLNDFFSNKDLKKIIPFLRVRVGISFTDFETEVDNIENDSGLNIFYGIGTGFDFEIYKKTYLKVYYMFDNYFFIDGLLFINSLNIAVAYSF